MFVASFLSKRILLHDDDGNSRRDFSKAEKIKIQLAKNVVPVQLQTPDFAFKHTVNLEHH